MMTKHTDPEPPDKMSVEDTTFPLSIKKDAEEVIAQTTATERIENVIPRATDISRAEALFKLQPTKLALFAFPSCKIRIGVGENKSDLYVTASLVDKVAEKILPKKHN